MPRLSIDITTEEHQRLKAMAALRGQSLKEFVLDATLSDAPDISAMSEAEAIDALKAALKPRIDAARAGSRSAAASITQIATSARKDLQG